MDVFLQKLWFTFGFNDDEHKSLVKLAEMKDLFDNVM